MAVTNIFVVCTPPLYGMYHVERLYLQLCKFYSKPFQLVCYYDSTLTPHNNKNIKFIPIPEKKFICERQWNKIDFFNPLFHENSHCPIIVMDLDWTLLSNIDDLVDIPITEKEFYGVYLWWKPSHHIHNLNGGMYKFFPSTTSFVYDTFIANPEYWQLKYLGNHPPPKGEQNFVYHHIVQTHKLKYFNARRIGRFVDKPTEEPNVISFEDFCSQRYYELYHEPYKSGDQYNSSICMIHGVI